MRPDRGDYVAQWESRLREARRRIFDVEHDPTLLQHAIADIDEAKAALASTWRERADNARHAAHQRLLHTYA